MKKMLVFFIVLAFAAPAMAADNLSLSGSMRVRTWDFENYNSFNDDDTSDKKDYIDQRLRIGAVITASDQVRAVTRFDFAEDKWGSDGWATWRYDESSELQIDLAYLDVTAGLWNIKAGQQGYNVGQGWVLNNNKPGVQVTLKTPVVIEVGYAREQDEDADAAADEAYAHICLNYKTETFEVEGFYAQADTDTTVEDMQTVFGVNGKTGVGPVMLNAELAVFGGDNGESGATAVDYVGTQFNVDADMKLSDMIKLGVDLIYSDGTDKNDEEKITYIGDPFGLATRSEGGSGNNIFGGDLNPLQGDDEVKDDVFDPFGEDQGALGLGLDVVITPIAGLDLLAHVMYLTPSEDTPDNSGWDSAMIYNIGVTYALAPKATMGVYYNMVDCEAESSAVDEDSASNIGGLLQISF